MILHPDFASPAAMCHSPWRTLGQPSGRGELGTGAWTSRMRRTPSTNTTCMCLAKTSHCTNDGQKKRPNRALESKENNHVNLPPFLASLLSFPLFFSPKANPKHSPPKKKIPAHPEILAGGPLHINPSGCLYQESPRDYCSGVRF